MRAPHEQSAYERSRIETISEADFWSAWSARDPDLKKAIALGKSGRKAAAYRALAEFHRGALAEFHRGALAEHHHGVRAEHHCSALGAEYEFAREEASERAQDPKARAKMWAGADDVLAGRVHGWHNQTIEFGRRIDFNANFGQSGQYGFHYMNWLTPLIDRFLVEGRPADLARVADIVRQYYAQRTKIKRRIPALHPVYYELGAWAKTRVLFPAYLALISDGASQAGGEGGEGRASAGDIEPFMKLFLGFGRSLMRLQLTGYRAGNWQIVGCAALFRLGSVFPELREAAHWRARALEIMEAHLEQDFFADGGHKERCWGYGWMSLDGVIRFYETGRRTGTLPAESAAKFLRTIRRAFHWFFKTITPANICPAYGDGDLTRADDILAASQKYLPDANTLLREREHSVCLRPSGYAIMRDDGSRESRYLNVNFGPTGGGHTNRDLLDFNAWAFGSPLIEEVGRFDSYDHPLNPFFRSPEAHNQVVLDHHPMARDAARGEDVVWRSTRELDYFDAWHDAFIDERGRGVHEARIHRHILFKRGEYWIIYDVIEPAAETIFTVSSWLHAVRPFRVLGPGVARVSGSPGCIVAFAHPDELKRLETGVDIAAAEVTADRIFPERHFLRARTWPPNGFRGCLRFCMLLYPFKDKAPETGIRPIHLEGEAAGVAEAFEIVTPAGRDRVVFNRTRRRGVALAHRAIAGRVAWLRGTRAIVLP